MQKTYILKPTMTFKTLPNAPASHKPSECTVDEIVTTIMPGKARAVPANKPRFVPPPQPLPCATLVPERPALKLGLDVHLEFIMVVAQRGHLSAQAPRQFTRPQLVEQVKRWVAEGLAVYCVQESCGFGFVLHRELVDAGAQSLLITPIALNDRRKTDKLDARALCLRLSRYLDGNRDELAPIRVPTEEEQRKREGTRRRQFLAREIRCLANRGHGQVAEYCHQKLPHRWWGTRNWRKLSALLDPWLLGVLEKLRELILALEAQLDVLEAQLVLRVAGQQRPKGLGEITLVTLDAEVCDWKRFHNRKQIGSYTGCCPGEHSSGGKRLVGSIDRMGNGRVRALLVEAVWRFLRWQPGWKSAAKMKVRLADGPAIRKKTVVALARQLAVDLWRWRTGRCTLADLGLIPG
jgi:transposase